MFRVESTCPLPPLVRGRLTFTATVEKVAHSSERKSAKRTNTRNPRTNVRLLPVAISVVLSTLMSNETSQLLGFAIRFLQQGAPRTVTNTALLVLNIFELNFVFSSRCIQSFFALLRPSHQHGGPSSMRTR